MVNPGSFLGTRKEFLAAQMDLYATAVIENHVADTIADIQRRYFKRYPISLAHNEEPSSEWLAQVDDNAADDDLIPPDETKLDSEAFKTAKTLYDDQVTLLKFRKEQIARRLAYQHNKAHHAPKRVEVGSDDPMVVLMAKLAGIPIKKPRLRPACTVWGQHHRQFVDAIFEDRVKGENVPAAQCAALRMRIYKECFSELEADEKAEYENQAVQEHHEAIKKIEKALNAPASEDPADRQRILQGLPGFIQPILDLVTEYTGWKATLMVGGPEPADQGRLNVMSFHSGETSGGVKMNFGRSERRAYQQFVTPIFGNFLKKCYTVEDCRAAALPDPTAASLADVLRTEGGNFSVDSAGGSTSYVRVARTPSGGKGPDDIPSTPNPPKSPTTYEIPAKVGPPIHARKVPNHLQSQPEGSPSGVQEPVARTNETSSQLLPSAASSASPLHPLSAPPSPCPSLVAMPPASPAPNGRSLAACDSLLGPPGSHASSPGSPNVTPPAPCASSLLSPTPRASESLLTAPPSHSTSEQEAMVLTAGPASAPSGDNPRKRRRAQEGEGEQAKTVRTSDSSSRRTRLRSTTDVAALRDQADVGSSLMLAQNTAPTAPLMPEELSGVPDWFLAAYQMLISMNFGPAWTQLVRTWAHFEKAEDFQEVEKLGSKGRPICVRDWIARTRSSTYRPDLGALSAFAKSFNAWWRSIQPDWRTEGSKKLLRNRANDLECLRRPGKNGLLSVLAALFFWAVSANKGGEGGVARSQTWKAAVDDVHWVLENLVSK